MPIRIIRADITKIGCDAIVNPSNVELVPSGGADSMIHRAAGEELTAAVKALSGCRVGEAKITPAFRLPSKYVIHTVGPAWRGGGLNEEKALADCYRTVLSAAESVNCESVAIPLISSGENGFPKDRVLKIALGAISDYLSESELDVTLVVYDKRSYHFSERLFFDVKAYIDDNYVEEMDRAEEQIYGFRERRRGRNCDYAPFSGSSPKMDRIDTPSYASIAPSPSFDDGLLGAFSNMDKSFSELLFEYIDKSGMSDVECYKRANVDKKFFSKIKCNKDYRPAKTTAIAFAISLKLSLNDAERLLRTAGYSFSKSNKFDVIIEYFITRGIYDIFEINETLFEFDQLLLGC